MLVQHLPARPDGGVNLDPQARKRVASGGHVVLVADQAAEPAALGRVDIEVRTIAVAPDEALGERRHELAVLAEQPAVVADVGERVVERAAGRVAFVDPDHHGGLRVPRGVGDARPLR